MSVGTDAEITYAILNSLSFREMMVEMLRMSYRDVRDAHHEARHHRNGVLMMVTKARMDELDGHRVKP